MNKKFLIFAIVALLLAALAVPALAATDNPAADWFKQRMEGRKAAVDQAVQNGQITPEQGQAWQEHFDQMLQYREQNGYQCPAGGPGRMGGGSGFGPGGGKAFGGGMRGFGGGPCWQNSTNSQ